MKSLPVLALCAYLAALPGLITACELRCAAAAPFSDGQPMPAGHCGAHGGSEKSDSTPAKPRADHRDCAGHAQLIRGTVPATEPAASLLTFVFAGPIASSLDPAARWSGLPEPAARPPSDRVPRVLRL